MAQITMVRNKDAAPVQEQPIFMAPGALQLTSSKALQELQRISSNRRGLADVGDEHEGRPGEGAHHSAPALLWAVQLGVTAGKSIRHGIKAAGAVLHGEVEAKQLADPLMLRNGGEALIQEKLQAVVVSADQEVAPPQVRAPMADSLHQSNKLPFVCRKLEVARGERSAEESEGPGTLV